MFAPIKQLFEHIGQFQSRLALSVIYWTLILVFAPVALVFDKSLQLGSFHNQLSSVWNKRQPEDGSLSRAQKQF